MPASVNHYVPEYKDSWRVNTNTPNGPYIPGQVGVYIPKQKGFRKQLDRHIYPAYSALIPLL
eukprot:TRINITY_DN2040_c0_g1_i1.p2 TRINITY_DN2040_c0_g1~~TRINITY_DN2040_c0_g1_i1.p2  ORF type:complete len:62 (-),score=7.56 TRINITY_DN2040_c0_g1_i1:27-212(-)